MNGPAKICVIGSANIDLIFRTTRLPAAGETIAARTFQIGCGGKGANQAVMAARLGADVSFVGRVGADSFGRQLLDGLKTHRVNTDFVRIDPTGPTGVASVYVSDEAQNSIVVADGANGRVTADDVRAAAGALRAARVLVCQLETPVEATLEAFRIGRAAGILTILNPAPAPARSLPDELMKLTDICVPNETEAAHLAGKDTSTLNGAAEAARAIRQHGPRSVIITLGSRGCLVDEGQGTQHYPARVVAAVDPTGAGDAFLGALAAALAEGATLRDAVTRAGAAAALSVTQPGAQASFPDRAEVETFLKIASVGAD